MIPTLFVVQCHSCEATMPDREEEHYVANSQAGTLKIADGWSEQFTRIIRVESKGKMTIHHDVIYTCPKCVTSHTP